MAPWSTFGRTNPICPEWLLFPLDHMTHPHPPHPHHHHDPDHAHPSAEVAPSLLRLSAAERLAGAAVLIALLWGAVLWAIA
jgi:hypothetical protein